MLTSLPQSLFHAIIAFVVPHVVDDDDDDRAWYLPPVSIEQQMDPHKKKDAAKALQRLALVSKSWYHHVSVLHCERTLSMLTLTLTTASRRAIMELRRRVALRGAHVRTVTIAAVKPSSFESVARIPWNVLFAHLPNVEYLDLRRIRLQDESIAKIIRAATAHCPKLERLRIPAIDGPPADTVFAAVRAGMKTWKSSGRGLTRIQAPLREPMEEYERFTEWIEWICTYCPNVERIDGYYYFWRYKADGIVCDELWCINSTTWERFCRTCTQLTVFDWVVVPFSTQFFEIFGRYTKPKLTNLTLSTSLDWHWGRYHSEIGTTNEAARANGGYGVTAKNAHAVLKACPALQHLAIRTDAPGYEDAHRRAREQAESDDEEPFMQPGPFINQEIFGDRFCEALVKHCPQLETLWIRDVSEGMFPAHPIMTLTDDSLRALATLRYLTELKLKAVNVTGKGLFALLNNPPNDFQGQRNYTIALGSDSGTLKMAFYKVVEALLRKLTLHSGPLPFVSRRVTLQLTNEQGTKVGRDWSARFLARLRALIQSLQSKYKSLRVAVVISGLSGNHFDEIHEITFHTASATPSHRPLDRQSETRLDNVFVTRRDVFSLQSFVAAQTRINHPHDDDDDDLYDDTDFYADFAHYYQDNDPMDELYDEYVSMIA